MSIADREENSINENIFIDGDNDNEPNLHLVSRRQDSINSHVKIFLTTFFYIELKMKIKFKNKITL